MPFLKFPVHRHYRVYSWNNHLQYNFFYKYRLAKINISDDDLHTDNIENLLNKIDLLLRIEKIEKSKLFQNPQTIRYILFILFFIVINHFI